jgi:hypothetical protein
LSTQQLNLREKRRSPNEKSHRFIADEFNLVAISEPLIMRVSARVHRSNFLIVEMFFEKRVNTTQQVLA